MKTEMPVSQKGVFMVQKKLILAGILTILGILNIGHLYGIVPYIAFRSQGLNTPRHLVGLIQQLYMNQSQSLLGTINGSLFYNRSFDENSISRCLFGIDSCQSLDISGSLVENRGENDLLADYFYLPTDFKSSVSFNPKIDNIGAEISFYIGLDEWTPGLYFAVYAPLVHSRWDLNICETIDAKGTNSHNAGYFTPDTLARNELLNSFTQYVGGKNISPINQTVGNTDYTITLQHLQNARISINTLNQTRLADIRALLGYKFVRKNRFNMGFQALITGPVGNRPEGEFLFDPTIGNGHHWELGGSIIVHGVPWQSTDESKRIIFTSDLSLTHLFAARQKRTFDLVSKPLSRYMLIERLGTPIKNNLKGNATTPSAQFVNEFLPVANLSTLCVDVSATIQAEVTALLTFVCDNFTWDIGYNLWARTCENLKLRGITPFENNSKWALKGDAQMFGFDKGAAGIGASNGAVPLSATQNNATIESGRNRVNHTLQQALLNPEIDSPQNATGDATGGMANNPLSAQPDDSILTIQTSINPIFLDSFSLDVCERRTHGFSNKLFTHFSYAWNERTDWIPYIGIGGEIEFAHEPNNSCESDCDECISCALSQWGIWLKGGMTF